MRIQIKQLYTYPLLRIVFPVVVDVVFVYIHGYFTCLFGIDIVKGQIVNFHFSDTNEDGIFREVTFLDKFVNVFESFVVDFENMSGEICKEKTG